MKCFDESHGTTGDIENRYICRRNGDLCKQQPNLAPIQSKDEGVSYTVFIWSFLIVQK